VAAAAFGAFMNQGQICMSTERIIVVEAIAEPFVEKFRAKVAPMKAGAMVDRKAVGHVEGLIEDAVSKGAVALTGGQSEGVIMPATVVDRVTDSMKLYREESFGPVGALIRAKDEEDAIRLANDSEYGLAASVFTRDVARGLTVARRIKSGICHVNGPTVHDEAQMPFGGMGASGYGRFGGKAGIAEFTDLRWITIETQTGRYPI
jgi:acyl-CoA reductase-like NAD-dependent aldehyde dehydrogenase